MMERLSWDSDFFGFETGALYLSENQKYKADDFSKYQLVYVFTPSGFFHSQGQANFMGKRITLVKCLRQGETDGFSGNIKCLNKSALGQQEINTLRQLAVESGRYSRFKKDALLGNNFVRLYHHWMDNIVKSKLDKVLAYCQNGEIKGMVTFSAQRTKVKIGLLAVREECRNKGIGSQLVQAVFGESKKLNGMEEVQVVTQLENEAAVRLYAREGFLEKENISVYHWHAVGNEKKAEH